MLDNKYNHENVEENKYAYWVDNGYLPVLRVQKNAKNNVWIGFQTAITSDITLHYEVNI